MSLYLKYRPQNFDTIVGQQHIVNTLKNAIRQNSLTHAYLFCGPRGTGKTSTARIIAKSLNCLNKKEGINPCDECDICQAFLNNQLIDLVEIDAASNRGIDEIRELREKIQFSPTQGKVKIYIIDEVHMLTKEAFNALLKTLEEPPSHAYFLLATTEAHKIPETIISRCQQFSFKRITENDITERLIDIANQENIEFETEALKLISKLSQGGLRDAIGLLEQMSTTGSLQYESIVNNLGITGHMTLESFYEAIINQRISDGIRLIDQVNEKGQNLNQFCAEFINFAREKMLEGLKMKTDVKKTIEIIEIFSEAKQQINQAIIPQLSLEIALIKACDYQQSNTANEKDSSTLDSLNKIPTPIKAETVAIKNESIKVEVSIKKPEIIEETTKESLSESEMESVKTPLQENAPNIDLSEIKNKWKDVVNAIHTPFVKMSFMNAEAIKFNDNLLCLKFKSSTLMGKIAEPKNQMEVVQAFKSILQIEPTLKLELNDLSIKTEIQVKANDQQKDIDKNKVSIADMAEEVFGG